MVIALIWLGYSPVNHVAATEEISMAMGCCLCPHAIIASNKMLPKCDEHVSIKSKPKILVCNVRVCICACAFSYGEDKIDVFVLLWSLVGKTLHDILYCLYSSSQAML